MKKILIIALALICLSLALVSCQNNNQDTPKTKNITYFLDGNQVESVAADAKVVAFVRPTNADTKRAIFDYSKNAIADGSENQNVYLFTVDSLYNSYEELNSALNSLEIGKKYGTKSYYLDYERGAAIYEVVESKSVKTLSIIPLTIGDQQVLTVDMYGAYGDGTNADNLYINQCILNKSANYIEFESDIYLQCKTINIKRNDLTLDGCGAVITNRYDYVFDARDNFTTNGTVSNDFVISGVSSNQVKNITLKNLEIRCTEMRCVGSLQNRYKLGMHDMLTVSNAKNVVIDNCKIIAPERTGIGQGIVDSEGAVEKKGEIIVANIDCVTFSGKNDNITLSNCTLQNFAGGPQGIEINVHGGTHTNYVICNNYVEKNCHDEIFTIYGCDSFDGADIYGNTFYSHDEPIGNASPHPLGFGAYDISGNVSNIKFHDNILNAVSTFDGMMFGTCDNIEIYNNVFSIRPNTKGESILYGFFRVPEPGKTTQKNIYIHDNKITITNTKELPIKYNCGSGFTFENNEMIFNQV